MSARTPAGRPSAVLFACGLNTVRSPMAAACARAVAGDGVYVASAGVQAGEPDPFVAAVMAEIGLDVSDHVPGTFEDLLDAGFDLVVTLSPEAHHHALEMTRTMAFEVEYWAVGDPTAETGSREQRLDAYRRLRDALMSRVRERLAQPAREGGTGSAQGD